MNRFAYVAVLLASLVLADMAYGQPEPPDDEDEAEDDEVEPNEDEGQEPGAYVPNGEAPTGIGQAIRTLCDGRLIRNINVRGVRLVDPADVLANMRLREGVVCRDVTVARDARALWDLGFFDDIVIEADLVAGGEAIDITVTLRERPAIAAVEFVGNDELDDDDLDEEVTLRENAILSIPDVLENVTKIRDLYAEEGHFLARITYELVPVGEAGTEVIVRFNINEGEEVTVRRIRFVGNEHLSADDITEVMETGETGFFSFIASNDTFDADSFEEDLVRLQALYYDHGYLAISVGTPQIELTPDRRYIDITVPVTEGPRFRIDEFTVREVDSEGNEVEPLGGREWVRDQIDVEAGDWFSRSELGLEIQEITRHYRDRGYAHADITPTPHLDVERRTVDIEIEIQRGPLVYIERINIRGNTKTRDRVIRREILLNEGELYSMSDLEEGKRNITRLGHFERVDVTEERGSAADQIVVNVEVAERSTGTFNVGAGFSSLESFILTAQINQRNLFGRGQSLALQLQLSGVRQLAQVQFHEPYLAGSRWSLTLEAFKTIRQFTAFNRDSTGGGFTIGHPIFDHRLHFLFQYGADLVDISDRTGGLFGSTGQQNILPERNPLSGLHQDGLTSSITFALQWDSRDNSYLPTDGVFARISAEVADRFLGSENIFTRYTAYVRYYRQLFDFLVLKTNFRLGLITSRDPDGVPLFERYYLGGIFNVRGFRLNSLGPRLAIPETRDPSAPVGDGIEIGGNLEAYYNIELEFPILESVGLRGVVFTDGGNAWNLEQRYCNAPRIADDAADSCNVNPLQIRTSWGFGLRWISPLGPLRFEWGLPFRPREGRERPIEFEFTIGNFF